MGVAVGFWTFLSFKLLGWTLTAAAVSLGAPFWFDLLQKIAQIRSSTKPADDARVASICLGHGVNEFWTADRDFSRFLQLLTRNPLLA